MQLRTYQSRDIAGIRSSLAGGARPVLSRSPTGSGKTVQFSTGVAVAAARGIRAAILGHQATVSARVLGSVAAAVASICLIPHRCVDVSAANLKGGNR